MLEIVIVKWLEISNTYFHKWKKIHVLTIIFI